MYGQLYRQGVNSLSIVGRLSTVQSVHYQRFHCMYPQVMQIERERSVKWAKMTTQWRKYSDSDKLYRRLNKGIPNSVRGTVWRHVMGVENVKEEGVYQVRWWNGGTGV